MAYLLTSLPNNNMEEQLVEFDTTTNLYQQVSTTVSDVKGSEITYSPNVDANFVIYELILQVFFEPEKNSNLHFELFEDDVAMGLYFRVNNNATRLSYEQLLNLKFVLPAYTGNKTYKMKVRCKGSGSRSRLNRQGSENSVSEIYSPILQMYSII